MASPGRPPRRARRPGADGTDPTPAADPRATAPKATEDEEESWGDRPAPSADDDRYLRDRPPHWG